KCDCEHGAKVANGVLPPPDTGFQNHLGIARGPKCLALFLQVAPDFGEVIDLAVIDERAAGSGIHHRLPRRIAQVQNGQARVSERQVMMLAGVIPSAPPVRTAVMQPQGHPVGETLWAVSCYRFGRHDHSGDSTHVRGSRLGWPLLAPKGSRMPTGPARRSRPS